MGPWEKLTEPKQLQDLTPGQIDSTIEAAAQAFDAAFQPKFQGKYGRPIAAFLEKYDDDFARWTLRRIVREAQRRVRAADRRALKATVKAASRQLK